jgi:hypothetical protein
MAEPNLADQIRWRAYEIWLNESCPDGRDHIHWLRAEAEFCDKFALAHSNVSCRQGLHERPPDSAAGGATGGRPKADQGAEGRKPSRSSNRRSKPLSDS